MANLVRYKSEKKIPIDQVESIDVRYIKYPSTVNQSLCVLSKGTEVEFDINGTTLTFHNNLQDIEIARTKCHFGNYRYWFVCSNCNKRFMLLYYLDNKYSCRKCHRLAYPSQNEDSIDLSMRNLRKIRHRLGASSHLSEPIPNKPKHMHWKTYVKLLMKEKVISQKYANSVISEFKYWEME